MKKIVLCENNKSHLTSQLRKAIMKRSRLKNKANKSSKPADKTAYQTQRNFVVKLKPSNRKCYKQNEKYLEIKQTFFH